jgi:DNA-directed RNA polymerase subunit L
MALQIKLNSDKNDVLAFTLSGVNVSVANAIRRTMLSDIETVVFRTSPHEQNKANIITNTTRLNNEILKQRLSCIPIHINEPESFPIQNYIVEVNVENLTDTMIYVTTKDFIVYDISSGNKKAIEEKDNLAMFPPNADTGHFIDFVRLRPRVSDDVPGAKLHFTCELSLGTSKQDGMFSAVSTCAYGFTLDDVAMKYELEKKKQGWLNEGKTDKEIKFESDNWQLLDGLRITKKDSFDFTLQSVGVFSNVELLTRACDILVTKLTLLDGLIDGGKLIIKPAQNTMVNCFDIILENEDYTIGKILEYMLHSKYFENNETRILSYCGFKKMHPHDTESIIRVSYMSPVEPPIIQGHLKECIKDLLQIYATIKQGFLTKLVK